MEGRKNGRDEGMKKGRKEEGKGWTEGRKLEETNKRRKDRCEHGKKEKKE